MKLYEELANLPGVSGNEYIIRNYMKNFIENYSNYEIKMDNLGSIFAYKKSKNPNAKTVMVAGHMDEVGFIVSNITKEGHLKVQPLGGFVPEVLISQVLDIHLENGEIIQGVIGSLPPHLRKKNVLEIKDFLLDIGATSKEEAKEFGVEVGNMVTFRPNFAKTKNHNRFITKAIDNRFGCGLALEAIKHFNDIDLDVNIAIGATVQEEVGLRGAKTATNLFRPDVFIALDSSPVNDLVSVENATLGGGFLIRIFDPRNIMHQGLLKYFTKTAKDNNINHQNFTSLGGTDAARALDQFDGILATTIGLPARYIHSSAAMFDKRDIYSAKEMLFKLLSEMNEQLINKIKGGFND